MMRQKELILGLCVASLITSSCWCADSLKDAFEDSFLIGTAVSRAIATEVDEDSIQVLDTHFNSITAENDMKWEVIHPEPGRYDFDASDAVVELAEKRGLSLVGHTLLWHEQTPDWVFRDNDGNLASRTELLERLENHIETVVGRYRGRVYGWDVVNEALNEDGTFRESLWKRIIGDDFIQKAFQFARSADPEAALYYNDYNLWKPAKRRAAVELIRALTKQGVRIDGVGIQGHYGVGYPDLGELGASIAAIGAEGIEVMITELDVSPLPFPGSGKMGADVSMNFELKQEFDPYVDGLPADVQRELTAHYRALFELFLKHREFVSRVTLWGISDKDSWRNSWPMKGRTDYPLLFDREYQPKSAVHELVLLAK
jgi:endo-1,4-beta-xylanase